MGREGRHLRHLGHGRDRRDGRHGFKRPNLHETFLLFKLAGTRGHTCASQLARHHVTIFD